LGLIAGTGSAALRGFGLNFSLASALGPRSLAEVDSTDRGDPQPRSVSIGEPEPPRKLVGAPAQRAGKNSIDKRGKLLRADPRRPLASPCGDGSVGSLGKLDDVVRSKQQVIATSVIIWQFASVAVGK
jgi:hypothetical protein